MQSTEGKGKYLHQDDLVRVLRAMADEVERGASDEGSITYEPPQSDDGQDILPQWGEGFYEVLAFYRVGNDMGQGGAVIIRDAELHDPE